jgi:NADH-quinone oxidoreductase subunit F
MQKLNTFADLAAIKNTASAAKNTKKTSIAICSGTGCLAYDSQEIADAFASEIEKNNLSDTVELKRTGCYGFCARGPIVVVYPQKICYLQIKVKDVAEIISSTVIKGQTIERLLYKDIETGKRIQCMEDIPFYKHQNRVLLTNNTTIDPKNILDYFSVGGYSALGKTLSSLSADDVVGIIKKANLRGRGGAGFAAGTKWETTKNAPGAVKYVIVNADEGDPGAYMDRSLLEGNPHSIIEGLIIGGYAMGAHEGFVYVRQEYPLALENTQKAITQAREYGLLGKNILGSGFDFDVVIHRGAGAFVSGESSALMSSIEGQVGEPRPKYIHLSVKGLWEKPTCLNNVETWANVPLIINNGAEWFRKMGTENSTGTKIFSLVGKVVNTGLVEVPMGISLRDIIYKIGGGIPNGKKLKGIQTGGPSGGVIPEKMIDIPVDFDELTKVGSMMGSGGMIVLDEDTCMVDTARYYIQFLAHESCGKCVPCREGLRQMLRILDNITHGNGSDGDIELLEELSEVIQMSALCALGTSAPNPVLSAIKYFREEFDIHIKEKRCPAGVCKALINYAINAEKCKACGACAKQCPVSAISKTSPDSFEINQEMCIKCGACVSACPKKFGAVETIPAFAEVSI